MGNGTGRPNVVLVITDDQGYGDLGCTGNPWIRTPNLDRFYGESVRFPDFHVQPLCTPTRGAIMSGRRPVRNGAWATCWGRSILRRTEVTMADAFRAGGYRTGMFGKWHLGDNYPYRPQDRGFERVVAHKGGGVGQTPDFWGNDYFDDTYFHNGKPARHTGYCTDVWFDEALKWIAARRAEPFFCYLATNAPHSPYLVEERYAAPYRGIPDIPEPAFYGMIASIDENFGRLRRKLQELGLEQNTILIFMTDNGSSGGCECGPRRKGDGGERVTRGYNAGMRGKKGSYYDGGHRVPFFARWPAGGLMGGRDIGDMCLDIDLLPTFRDLCGLPEMGGARLDGRSFAALLDGSAKALPERTHFLQYRQDTDPPEKWENAVLTPQWRLIRGRELYDIRADPGQERNAAKKHPDVTARLRDEHEKWWAEIAAGLETYCAIPLGNDAENPTRLTSMDVMGDVAWHQVHVLAAQKSAGRWSVDVERPGRYRFGLRRWPDELGLPIDAPAPENDARRLLEISGASRHGFSSKTLRPGEARLKVFDVEQRTAVRPGDVEAAFEMRIGRTGETVLEAQFLDSDGTERGVYYVNVERLGD